MHFHNHDKITVPFCDPKTIGDIGLLSVVIKYKAASINQHSVHIIMWMSMFPGNLRTKASSNKFLKDT